jgi:adenylate cyclase
VKGSGRAKKQGKGVLIGLCVAAAVIGISSFGLLDGLEEKSYDFRYTLKLKGSAHRQDGKDVVIVDIDDASLAALGRFQNWPRLYHAKVAEYMASGGAKAIDFDIFFSESDSVTPAMTVLFEAYKSDAVRKALAATSRRTDTAVSPTIRAVLDNWGYDAMFAASVAQSGCVYFPFYFNIGSTPDTLSDAGLRPRAYGFPSEIAALYSRYKTGRDRFADPIGQLVTPVPMLLQAAKGSGYYNIEPDPDGVSRRQLPFITFNGRSYPSMDLQIALDYFKVPPDRVFIERGRFLYLGDRRKVPIDDYGRFLITYFGDFKKFRYISYVDVLNENVPAAEFKDKIVIVGASAAGLMDLRSVPFSNRFPGPEVHANIIEMFLSGTFVTRPPRVVAFILLIVMGLLTVFIALRFKPLTAGATLIIFALVYFGAACLLFNREFLWIEVVKPLAVLLFTYMGILGYRYISEERQKLWIKHMFQGYMSKELVDKLLADPALLQMGGDRKEITVFFSDIRGFSSFSERLGSPERLIALINEYLGAMSDVVLEHGGYISKYEGDAIMAFWGAPAADADHAHSGVRCVWAMSERLKALNADLDKRGLPELFTRFGINTGFVTVGNVGSEKKKSYTAIGDSVNLGSRLEGANKIYGTSIILSEFTYAMVKDDFPLRELDLIRVVGKEQPVRIYELLALTEGDMPPARRAAIGHFRGGLAHFRARRWSEAAAAFMQALAADPNDGPSSTYLMRCRDFELTPPPPNWDGVFVMKEK